eukprot:TRINITY_DN94833_c0_g1_i1.p2 TRINITY_DN94833_c0_g1~~TRINITY_DN94833_c0_g1_i1.p2  ORF type:complete len:236 (+),score=36.18 TRINITY_DN94833_c0_g1_i1:115-822(+)
MLVVIADDHRLMREMLADNLRLVAEVPDTTEIVEAASYDDLHALAATRQPDLILLDYHMPGVSGLDGVKRVLSAFPSVPVVVISGTVDPSLALQCVAVGASGFIPKTVSSVALRNAIQVVLDGEKYIHAFALSAPAESQAQSMGQVSAGFPATPQLNGSGPRWSEREAQTLDLLIAGKTNKQIARELKLQEMTVKTHVRNIYRKLGAVNRADAVRMVLQARGATQPADGAFSPKG